MKKLNIAIDFGGTMVKLGIFQDEKLLHFSTYESTTSLQADEILQDMKSHLQDINELLNLKFSDYCAIAIAMPGIVNFDKKTLISINDKYDSFVGFDFETWCFKNLGLRCILDNDANAALLGEKAVGTLDGAKNAVIFILGTGIGTAAIINDSLLRGAHYQAGCIGGHLIADIKGRKCNCGTLGCVEAQASTWALREIVESDQKYLSSVLHLQTQIGIKELIEAVNLNDEFAKEIFESFILMWSVGVVNLVHAYDPEIVVLSGGPFLAGDFLTDKVVQKVNELAWTPYGDVKFVVSKNPKHSVIHGANYLIKKYLED